MCAAFSAEILKCELSYENGDCRSQTGKNGINAESTEDALHHELIFGVAATSDNELCDGSTHESDKRLNVHGSPFCVAHAGGREP